MNKYIVVSIAALLAGTLACAVSTGTHPTPVVITQVVVIPPGTVEPVGSTIPPPTASPALALPTITQQSLEPPTSTATATVASTATSSLNGPTATFIRNANCRAGPGTGYDVITSYFAGQTVEIAGRNPNFNNTWWQINMPTGGKCWVSFSTTQANGDFDAIPTVMP